MQCLPHLTDEGFQNNELRKDIYTGPPSKTGPCVIHTYREHWRPNVFPRAVRLGFSLVTSSSFFFSPGLGGLRFFFSSGIFEGIITPNKAKGGFSVLPLSCLYRHGIWTGLTSCCPWIASSVLHRFRFLPSLVSGWWSSDSEESRLPSTRWSWHSAEMFHKRSKCCLCFRVQLRMKSLPPIKRHQRPPEVPFIRDHGVDEDQG